MTNTECIQKNWDDTLRVLLGRLSLEDKYCCIGGIPGPTFELRSGTLPQDLSQRYGDHTALMAAMTGLEPTRIRACAEELRREYSARKIARKYRDITINSGDRLTLLIAYLRALVHRIRGLSVHTNNGGGMSEIKIRLHGRTIRVAYPANVVSLGLLWEIFVEQVYMVPETVEHIYDLGANIGLSALYFAVTHPRSKIICVEPLEDNLLILERNLTANHIAAEVVSAAAGLEERDVTLFFGDQSHALPSILMTQSQERKVRMLPFDRIIREDNYGLKVDIEGAEGFLSAFPVIVDNARWIVGELHYSGDATRDTAVDAFFTSMKKKFQVTTGRPVVYFIGNQVLLCQGFKTVKRLD